MSKVATIYHNPRCSKSRQALAILEETGTSVEIIEYLKVPPTQEKLTQLITMLNIPPHDILRTKENAYKQCGLSSNSTTEDIIKAINENPILLERPIVIVGQAAIIGRPPENICQLL